MADRDQPKIKWYLIDTERNFCKVWNFFICWVTIYNLIVTPFLMTFPSVYQEYIDGEYVSVTSRQRNLKNIERMIDIIYLIEIIFNFVKKTRARDTLKDISLHYLQTTFIFDAISTIPNLIFLDEDFDFYWLKLARLVHVFRLTRPLELLLSVVLQKYSKKRQNDLSSFCALILIVIYLSHLNACIWLYLGTQFPCKKDESLFYILDSDSDSDANQLEGCTASWVYANEFEKQRISSQYIFALYWIFEVITTVGYGDYSGATSQEYIFSIILEFIGLTFFSFLMGSITSIFNTSDNFDDLIEDKLDSLDMWIKKIEKSNKPFHIQPSLYNDIRKYVEQAFMYDFNLVIEEFDFFQQITPKMQTDIIQKTKQFNEFERCFNHFFEECERGFSNELIINMYCRIQYPGKPVISHKSHVKELYFIK